MRARRKGWLSMVLGLLVFAAICGVDVPWRAAETAEASGEEGRLLAEQAVRRAAVSCYAVEGAYPESYAYLKEHLWRGGRRDALCSLL